MPDEVFLVFICQIKNSYFQPFFGTSCLTWAETLFLLNNNCCKSFQKCSWIINYNSWKTFSQSSCSRYSKGFGLRRKFDFLIYLDNFLTRGLGFLGFVDPSKDLMKYPHQLSRCSFKVLNLTLDFVAFCWLPISIE